MYFKWFYCKLTKWDKWFYCCLCHGYTALIKVPTSRALFFLTFPVYHHHQSWKRCSLTFPVYHHQFWGHYSLTFPVYHIQSREHCSLNSPGCYHQSREHCSLTFPVYHNQSREHWSLTFPVYYHQSRKHCSLTWFIKFDSIFSFTLWLIFSSGTESFMPITDWLLLTIDIIMIWFNVFIYIMLSVEKQHYITFLTALF